MLGINIKAALLRASRAIRRDGFRNTLRSAFTSYLIPDRVADAFDSRYGTDTAGVVPLWKLRVDSPNERFGWRYETSDPLELSLCLRHIPVKPQALSFIDLGCGKGRMLIAARDLGFRNITGIEFATQLAEVARDNLLKARANTATVINADAAEFSFPCEDFLLYLFNPFSEHVMSRVLANLNRADNTRSFVVYNNARCAALFDSSHFLTRIACVEGTRFPTIIWSVQNPH